MNRSTLSLGLAFLLLAACGDGDPPGAGAATSGDREAPGKEVEAVLGEEAAAFLWFDSRVVSEAGHSHYGKYVHEKLLPKLAPAAQRDGAAWFVTFDGDCMTQASSLKDYFRPEDAALLEEADRIGASLCYVVAVLGRGTQTWGAIDRQLRKEKVIGYLGTTVPRELDRATFLRCREIMALVVASRIDGAKFKKIGYGFHGDDELKRMGFEPYEGK